MKQIDSKLFDVMLKFRNDMTSFVNFAFDWSHPSISTIGGADDWAIDLMNEISHKTKQNNFNPFSKNVCELVQIAIVSGHGIGKTAFVSWFILWILCTRPSCNGVVTANTSEQLGATTWKTLGMWLQHLICGHWFEYKNLSNSRFIRCKFSPDQRSWIFRAIPNDASKAEAFAGLHQPDSSVVVIMDEASAIADIIFETIKGAFTDGEPFLLCAGNPTKSVGHFANFFKSKNTDCIKRQIDSRDAKITNKAYLQSIIDEYGEDSDVARVRVYGQFPKSASNEFITAVEIDKSSKREYKDMFKDQPLIAGLDWAREGDDSIVLSFRRGLDAKSIPWLIINEPLHKDNSVEACRRIAGYIQEYQPDLVVADKGSIGASANDILREFLKFSGRHGETIPLYGVGFEQRSSRPQYYANIITEAWKRMSDWIVNGGAIPDDELLLDELKARKFIYQKDTIKLENKLVLKKELKRSCDRADSLALTFIFEDFVVGRNKNLNIDRPTANSHKEYLKSI